MKSVIRCGGQVSTGVRRCTIASHLCIINFQRAARRVDVTSIQVITCSRRRLDGIELDHCLDAILLEYHDAQNGAVRMTNRINHFLYSEKSRRWKKAINL